MKSPHELNVDINVDTLPLLHKGMEDVEMLAKTPKMQHYIEGGGNKNMLQAQVR